MILSIPMLSLSCPVDPLAPPSRKQGLSGPHVDYSRGPNTLKPVSHALVVCIALLYGIMLVFESGFAEAFPRGTEGYTFSVGSIDEQSATNNSSSVCDDNVRSLFFFGRSP